MRHHPLITGVLGLAAATVVGVGLTSPASADQNSSPWISFHEPDATVPAGRACSFAVSEHVVQDHEYYQNVSTYPDGTPKSQNWKGLLVIEFTNVESGATVTRNINGRARIDYASDGAFSAITISTGHFVGTIPPGNDMASGLYYVGGKGSTLSIGPDGTRTLVLGPNGSAENLCAALQS